MENVMIRANGLGMMFNLGIDKGFSLKQGFVDLFDPKKRKKDKSKNDFWALQDVNCEVKRGEVIGLVGCNGAGKSTLLKIVAGVYKPTRGSVETYGNVCPMIELGAGFDMDLSASENVYLNGAVMGYPEEFIRSKYQEIVDFSELQDFMDVPVKNFSSGMSARLAFSIATIVDPEILIVDEILSVGDAAFQAKSEEKMLSMINGGTTVLYVSHSVEFILKLCTGVIWLDHGHIVKAGEPEEVCREYLASLGQSL